MFSPYCCSVVAAPLSICKRSRSIGFNHHTHGNLNQARSKMPLLCLFTTQRPRGVFVKTVCAFETFDSAPVERMRGPCHLFVKRCLQLVRMCPEEAGFSQYLCFSPQSHQTSVSAKRQSGLSENSASRKLGR